MGPGRPCPAHQVHARHRPGSATQARHAGTSHHRRGNHAAPTQRDDRAIRAHLMRRPGPDAAQPLNGDLPGPRPQAPPWGMRWRAPRPTPRCSRACGSEAPRPAAAGSGRARGLGWVLLANTRRCRRCRPARRCCARRPSAARVGVWREGSGAGAAGPAHRQRAVPLRDQFYRPEAMARANGAAPLQSVEGLSLGWTCRCATPSIAPQLARFACGLPRIRRATWWPRRCRAWPQDHRPPQRARDLLSRRAEIQKAIEGRAAHACRRRPGAAWRADRPGRPAGRLSPRHGQPAGRRPGHRGRCAARWN